MHAKFGTLSSCWALIMFIDYGISQYRNIEILLTCYFTDKVHPNDQLNINGNAINIMNGINGF